MSRTEGRDWRNRVEWAFAALLLVALVHLSAVLNGQGHLPAPFLSTYSETLMDGVSTADWAHRPGAYDVWRSIYPPLSVVWFEVFSLGGCYRSSEFVARDCDWLLRISLVAFFVLNIALVWRAYQLNDRATAIPRALAIGMGMPMLFALERGNLIVQAFTFFVLGSSALLTNSRLKWLAYGLAVNFKPYLLVPLLNVALQRRWRRLEFGLVAVAIVYAVSYLIAADGSPAQLVRNIVAFADPRRTADWNVAQYPSSFAALEGYLRLSHEPLILLLGSRPLDVAAWALPLVRLASAVLTAVALGLVLVVRPPLPRYRVAALCVLLAITFQETGGYSVAFALYLLFYERWAGPLRGTALVLAYILSIPFDLMLVPFGVEANKTSYLSGQIVDAPYGLLLGSLLRPLFLLAIMDLLGASTLAACWTHVTSPAMTRAVPRP